MSQTQQKIHCQSSSFFNSTCSAAADGRGPHQNVIGYSIYGGNFSESTFFDLYLKSFRDTLRTVPIKYPGWVVRIYHELKSDDVESWKVLNNKVLTFHIMRDHPMHCLFFLGGCWGVKISQGRPAIVAAAEKMFHQNHQHKKGYDQTLLIRYFQSMATSSMVAHDSYCCETFPSQPYSTPRENNWFIGAPQVNPVQTLDVPCPDKCRPHNLIGASALVNWTLC